ncbi:MAG: hypothetical protein ACREC8_05220 [Limisphaerales bacterium]
MFWQAFNIFVRITGVWFILGGIVFIIWGLSLILNSDATINVNGVPSKDLWAKSIVLVAGLIISVLGILLLVARSYRQYLRNSFLSKDKDQSKN